MRQNLALYWAAPHRISRYNVHSKDYFVWYELFGCLVRSDERFGDEFARMPSLPGGDDAPNYFSVGGLQYCLHRVPWTRVDEAFASSAPFVKLSHKAKLCKATSVKTSGRRWMSPAEADDACTRSIMLRHPAHRHGHLPGQHSEVQSLEQPLHCERTSRGGLNESVQAVFLRSCAWGSRGRVECGGALW